MSARRWTWIDAPPWVWIVGLYLFAFALTPLVTGAVPATLVGWALVAVAAPVVLVGWLLLPGVIGEAVLLLYRWAVVDGWRTPGGPDADPVALRVLYVASRVALVTAPLVLVGWLMVRAGPVVAEGRDVVVAWLDPHFRAPGEAAR